MSATAERLATLVDALASEQGIDEVGMALLSRGIAATGATAGVCVVVTDGGELEMAASVGYDEHLLVPWNRFTVDRQVPVADAVRTGRVVVLTSNEEAVGRYPELEPFISEGEAMAAFPIVDGGRPIGAVARRPPHRGCRCHRRPPATWRSR